MAATLTTVAQPPGASSQPSLNAPCRFGHAEQRQTDLGLSAWPSRHVQQQLQHRMHQYRASLASFIEVVVDSCLLHFP